MSMWSYKIFWLWFWFFLIVALALNEQIIEVGKIPLEETDQKLNTILTADNKIQ